MFQYTVRRLAIALVTLLGITLIVFVVINLMPGDPASIQAEMVDPRVSARVYELLRTHFELDRPVHERYLVWLGKTVTGDFGTSFTDGRPVLDKVLERLPNTAWVATLSVLLGLAAAVPLGILQAVRQGRVFDNVTGVLLYAAFAVPSYVAAVLLIYLVGVNRDWLPFRGMRSDDFASLPFTGQVLDLAKHGVLIVFCFTYPSLAFDARFVRGNLLEVLRQDYVRTARAKGVPERRVVLKHAFRNTFIPLLTRLGSLVPALISGSVILEVIFNWPGLGRLFFDAIMARDYPVMMASVLISSVLVLVGILLADLLYAWADPRISYE
jgi:peptide/nickel transport system permease protein